MGVPTGTDKHNLQPQTPSAEALARWKAEEAKNTRFEKGPRQMIQANWAPPGGIPYKVKDGDTWITLARRFSVDVKALISFNFRTTNPDEVNWYLHWKVGCKTMTKDRNNWIFTSDADPGIVYIPPPHYRVPVADFPEEP